MLDTQGYRHTHTQYVKFTAFPLQQWLHERSSILHYTNIACLFFNSPTVHLDIIKVFYLPTDAQETCFKKNIKIYIKTAPTCFGAITIIRECTIRAC